MTAPTTSAQDVLSRIDDGLPVTPADRRMLDLFDAHLQWGQRPCLVCGAEAGGPECTLCVIAAEVEAKRQDDI
jgi:hypothetical protein